MRISSLEFSRDRYRSVSPRVSYALCAVITWGTFKQTVGSTEGPVRGGHVSPH